jgi:hypothetical protein
MLRVLFMFLLLCLGLLPGPGSNSASAAECGKNLQKKISAEFAAPSKVSAPG